MQKFFNMPAHHLSYPLATPPLSLTLALLGFCCILLLIFGVMALGIMLQRESMKNNRTKPKE